MKRIIYTLSNGLRVVAERTDGNVAYIGVLTNAGSRDDFKGRDGLAHFVEHTIFKGTSSRSNWHISNRMESVGGELNAYTTKEEIMLYTNAPAGFEERGIELLADLVKNSIFPPAEINKERGVILEEILSYKDNPSYAVFDEFDELFYAGSSLAHNILGYPESVKEISQDDASEFLNIFFAPQNMVMYCVSPADPEKNIRLIEKYFGGIDRQMPELYRQMPPASRQFSEIRHYENHQANVVMGIRMFASYDPRRYSLFLLSNILGGPAMNSILNSELRDRRGLVYTVESISTLYSDAGAFQVYFGCEPRNVEKCSKIILREIRKLAEETLSPRKLANVKRQLCGQLLVNGDNRENCAMAYAKSLMRHGEVIDNALTAERIRQVSAEELRSLAEKIASSPWSKLILV